MTVDALISAVKARRYPDIKTILFSNHTHVATVAAAWFRQMEKSTTSLRQLVARVLPEDADSR